MKTIQTKDDVQAFIAAYKQEANNCLRYNMLANLKHNDTKITLGYGRKQVNSIKEKLARLLNKTCIEHDTIFNFDFEYLYVYNNILISSVVEQYRTIKIYGHGDEKELKQFKEMLKTI
jgi:hypothetical protein